jgi:acetoin utilization deacetylase AcuC-like enzyme
VSVPVVYSARYHIDIGCHVFPTRKYRLVRERLASKPFAYRLVEPEPASWKELQLVHTPAYLSRIREGRLTHEEVAQLELPWSPEMVEGFRLMTGGTIDAACLACGVPRHAAADAATAPAPRSPAGIACHIGGGLHHAFPDHGEGFCPFNDVAVAVRVLQSRGLERAAIVDLDVHQGNGTAFIFESDPRVFTCSIHEQHNYPDWKPRGSLDIGLAGGAGDETFLRQLEGALPRVMAHDPQCVFYLAGADPYEDDQLGGLRVTRDGLRERDRMVIDTVAVARMPLVIVLAGGYARNVDDTVAIHAATIDLAIASRG